MQSRKEKGCYYTTNECLLEKVVEYVRNREGLICEPSVGAGHIIDCLMRSGCSRQCFCVEIDQNADMLGCMKKSNVELMHGDFLQMLITCKFSTVVGNPPYVKRKGKKNLYIDFIDKCLDLLEDHGELVFIIPSDFFKLTSAAAVKRKMWELGSITDVYHPHNEQLFCGAAQDIVVMRFQKGKCNDTSYCRYINRDTVENKRCQMHNGNFYFLDASTKTSYMKIADAFDVKVGMVSGADEVFKNDILGNMPVLTSRGIVKCIFASEMPNEESILQYLQEKKERLLGRRIRKFNEDNWFEWGCPRNMEWMKEHFGKPCVYANTLTRRLPVFFVGQVCFFDGGLLCLLPKNSGANKDLAKMVDHLNSRTFLEHFSYAGRYKIGQRSLSNCVLPVLKGTTPSSEASTEPTYPQRLSTTLKKCINDI
jgi:adenine-specific DNA-methyltransferase